MKDFFVINCKLCFENAFCEKNCPTKAVFFDGEKYVINSDKCIACGTCFRNCPNGAVSIDIPYQEIREMEVKSQRVEELEVQLDMLAQTNRSLRENNRQLYDRFATAMDKVPHGVIFIDTTKKILFANDAFIELAGFDMRELAKEHESLTGIELSEVLPPEITSQIIESLYNDDDILNCRVVWRNKILFISSYTISKSNDLLVTFRDVYNGEIFKEEISARLDEVVSQNMAMIQKIGFLMGEEMAKSTKTINGVIASMKETL